MLKGLQMQTRRREFQPRTGGTDSLGNRLPIANADLDRLVFRHVFVNNRHVLVL